jgi:cell division protein ZipA
MMSELRWWLLILGVAVFAALTVWELRRPRQASGRGPGTEPNRPREPLPLPEIHAFEPMTSRSVPVVELPEDTGTFPVLVAAPREAEAGEPERATETTAAKTIATETASTETASTETDPTETAATESTATESSVEVLAAEARNGADARARPLPELPSAPAPLVEWPPDEQRRIVALRLVAPQPERFAGRSLRQALAAEGFVLGRFDIFHKPDEERRAILSAASLTRPGTFDAETMDSQHYGGLSLFAVLPGPMPPPQAFEELVTTARSLNDRLCGVLQDEGGTPLTPARIASLRERLSAEASS